MTHAQLETAAAKLTEWQRRLAREKANGTLTEAQQTEETVLKLAQTGLRMEQVKLADLVESARGMRITEVVPSGWGND